MWLSRALTISLGLVLMPVLFHHFPSDGLGAWLLLAQAGGIVSFLDFGITSVLTRRLAFASVAREGDAPGECQMRLAELIAAAKLLYRFAAALAFAVSLGVGWWFLARIGLRHEVLGQARTAWAILCVGYAVGLSGGLWSASVWGLGHMTSASVVTTVCGLATLAAQVASVLLGGGMVTLALVALAGSLTQRWALFQVLRRREPALLMARGQPRRAVMAELVTPSLKYWVTEIGAVLLLRTDQLFIAGLHETWRIPAYYAAYSLVYNMAMVAMAVGDVSFVQISRLWRDGAIPAAHALVLRNTRVALALVLSGAATMAVIGESAITVWLGAGHFIGAPVLLTFCLMLVLFVQQSLMFGFARATEHEAFAGCYLTAGVLNIGLTWALASWFGLPGVALATLVAQALTTTWFVPASALRRLRIAWRDYAVQVQLPAVSVGGLTYLVVWCATYRISPDWAMQRLTAGAGAGIFAMCAGFWILIFDATTRTQVRGGAVRVTRRLRAYLPRRHTAERGTRAEVHSTND